MRFSSSYFETIFCVYEEEAALPCDPLFARRIEAVFAPRSGDDSTLIYVDSLVPTCTIAEFLLVPNCTVCNPYDHASAKPLTNSF